MTIAGPHMPIESTSEQGETFPVLQRRKRGAFDARVDIARRELWRAFQRGALTESELARTLDRLDTDGC